MKKLLLCFLVLLSSFLVCAGSRPFRSGIILAAELSKAPQQIRNFDESAYPELPRQNIIYAQVVLTVFNGRALSRFDYSINAFGQDCKCVAIKTADGPWIADNGDIQFPKEKQKYAMLFILDNRVAGLDNKEKLSLKCNYPPAKYAETPLIFTNRKTANFTRAGQIPAKGILTENK